MTDDETPDPAKRKIIRGPVSTTPPAPDALREELASEQIRDFQEIVDATPSGRPYLLYTVGEIADHLVDIYDHGTMGDTVTWDLIAELMRRIPDSDLVEIEPSVPRVRIVPETAQDAAIAEEYESYNDARTPQDPPVRPARPLEDETVRQVSPDVIGCRVLTGYVVELIFDEGTVKAVDLSPFLWGEMFERVVADYELFRQVHVDPELGTIAWPGDIDISPEALWVAPAVEPGGRHGTLVE